MNLMNLFTPKKTDSKKAFYEYFLRNPDHDWIAKNPKILKCFHILFNEFSEEHYRFFLKKKVTFLFSYAELSFTVGNLEKEYIVVVFPDLYKKMSTSLITEACATLAHELGHIYHAHHEKKISKIESQLEADRFAVNLGFKEDLIKVLLPYAHLDEVKVRLKHLK